MKHKFCLFGLITVGWLLAAASAGAATSCWISAAPTEFAAIYSSSSSVRINATVTVRCQTTSGTQAVNYTLTPNNGLNSSGVQNRAQFGSNYLDYDFYTNNSCNILWPGLSGTITATTSGAQSSATVRQCLKTNSPAPTAGYYTDIETLTLSVSTSGVIITGTNPWVFPVSLGVPVSCQISSPPGDINFGTYTAFSTMPLTASTTFTVRCTDANLPITLDIGASAGGIVPSTGLNYALAINIANTGGANPPTSTARGTAGTAKTFYINGTMPAGQAGTCTTGTCTGSDIRTLTITY